MLEIKVLFLLQEFDRKLLERVNGVHGDLFVLMAADLTEMISDDAPDSIPHDFYSVHVLLGDLDYLLKTKNARVVCVGHELALRDLAQGGNEVKDRLAIELC